MHTTLKYHHHHHHHHHHLTKLAQDHTGSISALMIHQIFSPARAIDLIVSINLLVVQNFHLNSLHRHFENTKKQPPAHAAMLLTLLPYA